MIREGFKQEIGVTALKMDTVQTVQVDRQDDKMESCIGTGLKCQPGRLAIFRVRMG